MPKKGIDYSKWDKIDDSDDEQPTAPATATAQADEPDESSPLHGLSDPQKQILLKEHPELAMKAGLVKKTSENKDKKRKQYLHEGRLVYEWDQSLDEINIYIDPPKGITTAQFDIAITSNHLMVGIKGNKERYLNHTLWGLVKYSESFWTIEDGELHITLTKLEKAKAWDAALQGHEPLDPLTATEVRTDIMRERFQEEHPGFDFSGATFNGQVPDPSKFMGGYTYK